MHRFWFPFLTLAVACGHAAGDSPAESPPPKPPQPAASAPVLVAPAPQLPALEPPRIVAAADVRLPKSSNKKDPRRDTRIQIFFPNDAPRPLAGETADILGPDGYRFTAKVSYLKEEVRFAEEGKPFQVTGVGYYALLQPISIPDGVEISPKGELLLAAIPGLEERKTRAQAVSTPPDDTQRPDALKGVKLTSYADSDGDGKVDIIAGTLAKDNCRLVYVKEKDSWQERRKVCGAFPQQIRISTAPPEPKDPDPTAPTGTTPPTTPVDPKKPTGTAPVDPKKTTGTTPVAPKKP